MWKLSMCEQFRWTQRLGLVFCHLRCLPLLPRFLCLHCFLSSLGLGTLTQRRVRFCVFCIYLKFCFPRATRVVCRPMLACMAGGKVQQARICSSGNTSRPTSVLGDLAVTLNKPNTELLCVVGGGEGEEANERLC